MPIILRFVASKGASSAVIRWAENYEYSHVEAVTPNGNYLGALFDGGVAERPSNYDAGEWTAQAFWTYPADTTETNAWVTWLRSKIGVPYDWEAIVGFAVRESLHERQHIICSALQSGALTLPVNILRSVVVPWHEMSPRDLAIACSALVPLGPRQTN